MGAGHVDPTKVVDPGLVYDITTDDYVDFFCASGLTFEQMKAVTGRTIKCSKAKKFNPWDLNYPAISVVFNASKPSDLAKVVVTRMVTNIGDAACTYTVAVTNPEGVTVTVDPQQLLFGQISEQESYMVKISAETERVVVPGGSVLSQFGQLSWKHGSSVVTSPIVAMWI